MGPDPEVYKDQVKETYLYWKDQYVRTRGMSAEQIREMLDRLDP